MQTYWLNKLYDSIKEELSKEVLQCIKQSDQTELMLRMKEVNTSKKSTQEKNISIQKSLNESKTSDNSEHLSKKKESNSSNLQSLDFLVKDLSSALHQTVDSIKPINLRNLDSLITVNFKSRGINAKLYYTDIIDLRNHHIVRATSDNGSKFRKKESFIYEFTDKGTYAYRVYLEPLMYTVLVRMSGILITTLLITIILSFAFWYLIKTVIRQKTLEEMKDDFVNNITHELKTPIAVAYSAADSLLNFKQGDDKMKRDKYLTICKDQLSELSGLVEQILSMSMERRQMFILNKENICIYDMINSLILQHRLKSNKQIGFELQIPKDLMIYADPIHLNNIISNLIDNAIKYSEETINIEIEVSQKDEYNIIEIRDNGIGIPEEKKAYIFDKFYRVTYGDRYNVKGYGLGLFYVKTMVEKHNGLIYVDSNKNRGTVFLVKIPK